MAYRRATFGEAAYSMLRFSFQPDHWRAIARATLDWQFCKTVRALHPVAIDHIKIASDPILLHTGTRQWGETPCADLVAICALVRAKQPHRIFEFGTFTGNGTLHLAMNSPSDTQIHTVDLPRDHREATEGLQWERDIDDEIIGREYLGTPYASRIKQIYSDTRVLDVGTFARGIDFVWIDACHEYEFVKSDTAKAMEMLAPGGVIAWHDVSRACPGVVQCLNELAEHQKIYRVVDTQVAFYWDGFEMTAAI